MPMVICRWWVVKKIRLTVAVKRSLQKKLSTCCCAIPRLLHAVLVAVPDLLMGENCAFIVSREVVKSVALRRYLREQDIADSTTNCQNVLSIWRVAAIDAGRENQQAAVTGNGHRYANTRRRTMSIPRLQDYPLPAPETLPENRIS